MKWNPVVVMIMNFCLSLRATKEKNKPRNHFLKKEPSWAEQKVDKSKSFLKFPL